MLSVKSVNVVTTCRNQIQRIIGLITTSTVNVAEKDAEKLTEEEVLEQMHGSPELKGLDEYIASFCALGGKSQAQEIVNEHLKTRK